MLMTTSHAAAAAVAACFLEQDALAEADVELFYAEVFPRLSEGQRELIFDWLVASVEEVTKEDVAHLLKALQDRPDFGIRPENTSAAELIVHAQIA